MPTKRKIRPVRLYVAILNKGWIRREIYAVLEKMKATPGVEVTVENLNLTFAQPIFANRNRISKRFLAHKPKQDYLMMIDDDIIPLHNPAELVFAKKDIVGSPAKVRQRGRTINWVAYMKHPDVEGYFSVDFANVDDTIDLLSVDIIGTGCILIRRRVLEKLFAKAKNGWDAPFTIEVSETGDSKYGTDFAFCKRAQAAGYKIYTTPQRICEHVKELGLLDIQGYDDCDGRDAIAGKYAIPWGDFAISQNDWHFINDIIEKQKIRKILEFGSGLSTLLMSEIAEVTSYETDGEWIAKVEGLARGNGHPERALSIIKWDGKKEPKGIEEYDLAFVDGPKGKDIGGVGRELSMKLASEHAQRIIVHDAGRQNEQKLQAKYLRGKFRLKARNGWHAQRCQYWEKISG